MASEPSERFHLLSLHKTRSESQGAAPPQIFPILEYYAPPQKRSDSPVFMRKSSEKILRRQTNYSAGFFLDFEINSCLQVINLRPKNIIFIKLNIIYVIKL